MVPMGTKHEMETFATKYSVELNEWVNEWHDEYLEDDPTYIVHLDAIIVGRVSF